MKSVCSVLRGSVSVRGALRSCSTAPASSAEEASEAELSLPSGAFLKTHIRTAALREKLADRVSELQLFKELNSGGKPPQLDDSSWLTFLQLKSPEERARYLLELPRFGQVPPVDAHNGDKRLVSEINQERADRGEVVYAPGFNSLIELQGREFRSKIDSMFGSRLLAQERVAEELPKLVVDCRFMRDYSVGVQTSFAKQINSLHEANWLSKTPFRVGIANFTPDNQLSDIAKRSWLFRYGPPGTEGEDFRPNPFAPSISARGVKDVAGCDTDSIVYISWRANQFLPDEPLPAKAVVVCASNDHQPWSSSVSAAQRDKIKAYRIPVQRHVMLGGAKATLSLAQSAAVLAAYFSGEDIGPVLRQLYNNRKKSRMGTAREEKELVEKYKAACEGLEREKERQAKYQQWLMKPAEKKPRVHKYSREERRRRIAAGE